MLKPEILRALSECDLIDISQPISTASPCFPGDTHFSYKLTMTLDEGPANVTSFTMSPHVGTHTDAPEHIVGQVEGKESVGGLSLKPYFGPASVVEIEPGQGAITESSLLLYLEKFGHFQKRVLFKTRTQIPLEPFAADYAFFNIGVIDFLAARGVELIGIDTPSVDHVDSESLEVHHRLLENKMFWLENLDMTLVREGEYCLVAMPLKFLELEASPIRAVLLNF